MLGAALLGCMILSVSSPLPSYIHSSISLLMHYLVDLQLSSHTKEQQQTQAIISALSRKASSAARMPLPMVLQPQHLLCLTTTTKIGISSTTIKYRISLRRSWARLMVEVRTTLRLIAYVFYILMTGRGGWIGEDSSAYVLLYRSKSLG